MQVRKVALQGLGRQESVFESAMQKKTESPGQPRPWRASTSIIGQTQAEWIEQYFPACEILPIRKMDNKLFVGMSGESPGVGTIALNILS